MKYKVKTADDHGVGSMEFDVELADDGTLDTIIVVNGEWQRWDSLPDYRDEWTGQFDLKGFMADHGDEVIGYYLDRVEGDV